MNINPDIKTVPGMTGHRIDRRNGFTLVELLLVISIVTVLASLALFVVRGARDDARTAATTMRIDQATEALETRMLDYEFRRVPLRLQDFLSGGSARSAILLIRNRIIADMIHVELAGRGTWDPVNNVWVFLSPETSFPSPDLQSWINEVASSSGVISDPAGLIAALNLRQSSVVHQLALIAPSFVDSSQTLAWVLENTDLNGVSAADSMGSRPFVLNGNRTSVVDGFDDPVTYRVMYVDIADDPTDTTETGVIEPVDELPPGSGMVPLADAIRFDSSRSWNLQDIDFANIRIEILSENVE